MIELLFMILMVPVLIMFAVGIWFIYEVFKSLGDFG